LDGTNEGLPERESSQNTAGSSDVVIGIGVNPASPGAFVHGHPPSLPSNFTSFLLSSLLQIIIHKTDPSLHGGGQSGNKLCMGGKVIRKHMESGCTVSATSPSMLEDEDIAVITLEVDMSDFFLFNLGKY
jgi:hypothetical protein